MHRLMFISLIRLEMQCMLFSGPSYDVLITRLTRDERMEEQKLTCCSTKAALFYEAHVVCTYVSCIFPSLSFLLPSYSLSLPSSLLLPLTHTEPTIAGVQPTAINQPPIKIIGKNGDDLRQDDQTCSHCKLTRWEKMIVR